MHVRTDQLLKDLRAELRALPGFEPPPDAWQRILAKAEARDVVPRRRPYVLAAGIAAAAVAVGALLQVPLSGGSEASRGATSRVTAATAPAEAAETTGWQLVEAENARLEAMLAALPATGHVRARTAYTVATLEDRLAMVDDQLSTAAFEPRAPGQSEQLWRERLYLMNSLVKIRYAQATAGL